MQGMVDIKEERERLEKLEHDIEKARHNADELVEPHGTFAQLTDAEERTQREVREQAELAPDDPDTSREELELDLMEENASERGERLG